MPLKRPVVAEPAVAEPAAPGHRAPGDARTRAFTLVEIAIVLAVIIIFSTAIVPNIVQEARDGLAERTVTEMLRIQDAAKAYFLQRATDPTQATWPGQNNYGTCSTNPAGARLALTAGGYLAPAELINPWNFPYVVSPDGSADADACGFEVATQVPQNFEGYFEAYLPQGSCAASLCGVSAGAGNVACCVRMNKPGIERMLREFIPKTSERICEDGLGGEYEFDSSGARCNLEATEHRYTIDSSSCYWTSGVCPLGYRAIGASCGKNCGGSSRVQCCKVYIGGG